MLKVSREREQCLSVLYLRLGWRAGKRNLDFLVLECQVGGEKVSTEFTNDAGILTFREENEGQRNVCVG
jgi:hypothetical protein